MKKTLFLVLLAVTTAIAVNAQLYLSGSSYTQNFNSIGSGLPTGWEGHIYATATSLGYVDSTYYGGYTATTAFGAYYDTVDCPVDVWGCGFKNSASANGGTTIATSTCATQEAQTDRCFAVHQITATSHPGYDPGAAFCLHLANTAGLTGLSCSFKLQSLDQILPRVATWVVDYGFGASPTSFTTATAVGTMTTGGYTFSNNTITVNFGSALDNSTVDVWIRISAQTTTTGTGTRPTTGIDDFNLTWSGTGTTGITGTTSACIGATSTLSDATTSGTWSSSSTTVATVGATSGIVTGVNAGTTNISYTVGGSTVITMFTVNSVPSVTASVMGGTCGSTDSLVASGATTYTWSPTTGLSCASCAITGAIVSSTTAYSVTGTNSAGCSATATVSVDGNSIGGMITFSSTPPSSMGMKVWLIQFNSTDSSLIAQDSMATCLDGGVVPSYRFMDKPAGNYMVKAKLLSSVAGTTGYIPTYSLSTPHWDSAVSAVHGTGSDVLNINMLYVAQFLQGLVLSVG